MFGRRPPSPAVPFPVVAEWISGPYSILRFLRMDIHWRGSLAGEREGTRLSSKPAFCRPSLVDGRPALEMGNGLERVRRMAISQVRATVRFRALVPSRCISERSPPPTTVSICSMRLIMRSIGALLGGALGDTTKCGGADSNADCFSSLRTLSGTYSSNSLLRATVLNGPSSCTPMGLLVVGNTADNQIPFAGPAQVSFRSKY